MVIDELSELLSNLVIKRLNYKKNTYSIMMGSNYFIKM